MIGNILRTAAPCLALLAACLPAPAQAKGEEATLDAKTLITLHEAGVPAAELERLFDRHGVGRFTAEDIQLLRQRGVPEAVVRRVEIQVKRRGDSTLTVADVVDLTEAGVPPADIIASIRVTESRFDLTIDDLVELARRRVSADVIKEMRARGAAAEAAARQATSVTLEDVADMAAAGFGAEEILGRIRAADARFHVAVDDILQLTRKGVPEPVLKEIWSRRAEEEAAAPVAAPPEEATPPPAGPIAPAGPRGLALEPLRLHREASGGFSISVPESFALFQETRNRNTLVSFTDRRIEEASEMADAEIQVLRYRSLKPERLVERNLDAVGGQFLTSLRASYAKKGMELSHTEGARTFLSGLPAAVYRVSSTAADGTSHEGRLAVTFIDDQVFVLSFAVRSDLFPSAGPALERCLGSFAIERESPRLALEGDPAAPLFEHWRDAVTRRDYPGYRALLAPGKDDLATRAAFGRLADRLGVPDLRLVLEGVDRAADRLILTVKAIRPSGTENLVLAFRRAAGGYYLVDP